MTLHTKAGRLSAVRPALASHLFAPPPTPFCRCAAFPLKGKQEIPVLSPCAFLGYRKHHRPLRPLEGGEGHEVARGCSTVRASNDTPCQSRPPFGGQASISLSSLCSTSYTLLPLRGTSPRESMSLDSRLALLPYESSSFATLKGKQEIPVLSPCAFLGYRKHHRPLRPLEGERATKWRGGVLR